MESTLDLDVLSKSQAEEIIAEETTEELDDILDEVVNLALTAEAENSVVDNIVSDGDEAFDETDFAMQTGDHLELEIDLPMEATEPQAKITPLAEETESILDALIHAENEVMASLAKEAGANDSGDSSSPVTSKDSEYKDTEKTLAEDSKKSEDGFCDASLENAVSEEPSDNLPSYNEKSSKDFLCAQESEREVEDIPASLGKSATPHGSIDQLADVVSEKIEMTIARLVEERLSAILGRSIEERLERILVNIR